MSVRAAIGCLVVAVLAVSCSKQKPRPVKDTEGRTFEVLCAEEPCAVKATSGAAGTPSLRVTGRFLGVCTVEGDRAPDPVDCRPLVCESDGDCPARHGLPDGSCLSGLCIEPEGTQIADDAVMLCLAGTGLGKSTPQQFERYALAVNCGNPCVIPRVCRQP